MLLLYFTVFDVLVADDQFATHDGTSTGTGRTGQNEVLVKCEDGVDQSTAVDYDRSLSSKSVSTNSRAGKAGDPLHSSSTRQGRLTPAQGDGVERSIYDNTPEHYYANVEKDESGRLLNRDTLAFRTSDFEMEKSSMLLAHTNGQDVGPHLVDTSAVHSDRLCEVPVVIRRTNKSSDGICTNSVNHHSSAADRTQSDTATGTTDHVPYHTGRSTFYKRVDPAEGTVCY